MKVKEESEKVGLKLNIQKTKIMASDPITSWKIDGETVETVRVFVFWGSKITADSDYSREIKRQLLLGIKAMTNLDSILKSRDITLLTKVCIITSMVFAELGHKEGFPCRTDASSWRRLLRVSWTARRSSQSILMEINSEYSLEGLMLKLKL